MSTGHVVVATRKSKLALAQSRAWMRDLGELGVTTEELHVTTTGDRIQDVALRDIGGKGLFIKEIEQALLDGRANVAVHSMKDVPGELAPGLTIGCIPRRADPRDVLVTRDGRTLDDLAERAKIGTSSLRRGLQLRSLRPDLDVVPLRGNVDTRLRKLGEGHVDAIVLAAAGLERLGMSARATETLEPERCLPAVGQGALAIEHRSDDEATAALLAPLHDAATAMTVSAERGVMVAAEGSCQVPIAGYAIEQSGELWLRGMLAEPDGSQPRFLEARAPWPSTEEAAFELGLDLGRGLLEHRP